jgi:putative flippase GtrA
LKISWKHLWQNHQLKIRFFIIGSWNTIFSYLTYVGFYYLLTFIFQKRYVAYMTAAILSNIIAAISAFLFHKHITFKSTVKGKGVIIEFFKFYSTYTVIIILGFVLLPFFVEVMKIDPKISGALLIPIVVVVSYFGHSRFSFANIHSKKR